LALPFLIPRRSKSTGLGGNAKTIGKARSKGLGSFGSAFSSITPSGNVKGRLGSTPIETTNAASNSFQFQDTQTPSSAAIVKSYPLTNDGDYIALNFAISGSVSGGSAVDNDVFDLISEVDILNASGTIMKMTPATDFYDLAQRFGPLHTRTSVVTMSTVGTTYSNAIVVYGISLPSKDGPYTLQITYANPSTVGTGNTGSTVSLTVQATIGTAPLLSNYVFTQLPFTPVKSGIVDLSPLVPIQGPTLSELFISGMTSNTADIDYVQIISEGNTVTPRVTSGVIQSLDNAEMVNSVPSTELFPLFALKSNVVLGRTSHFYVTWGSSPSSSIRLGFYYLT
jgi:hypothetical protein